MPEFFNTIQTQPLQVLIPQGLLEILPNMQPVDITHADDFSGTSITFGPIDSITHADDLIELPYFNGDTPDRLGLVYKGTSLKNLSDKNPLSLFRPAHRLVHTVANLVTNDLAKCEQAELKDPAAREKIILNMADQILFGGGKIGVELKRGFCLSCLPASKFGEPALDAFNKATELLDAKELFTVSAIIAELECVILNEMINETSLSGEICRLSDEYIETRRYAALLWNNSFDRPGSPIDIQVKSARLLFNASLSNDLGYEFATGVKHMLAAKKFRISGRERYEMLIRAAYYLTQMDEEDWAATSAFLELAIREAKIAGVDTAEIQKLKLISKMSKHLADRTYEL